MYSFYKLSRAAEKIQESFVKLVDENKGEEMLMKAQGKNKTLWFSLEIDKMIKTKMEAQESGQVYRQQIVTPCAITKIIYSFSLGDYKSMVEEAIFRLQNCVYRL